jgi:hypothetical protein
LNLKWAKALIDISQKSIKMDNRYMKNVSITNHEEYVNHKQNEVSHIHGKKKMVKWVSENSAI